MLDVMRRHSQSFLIYLIFGAIVVVFAINFGPGAGSCVPGGADWVAEVEGDVIPKREFDVVYARRLDAVRRNFQQSGMPLSDELAGMLRQQILDSLVERELLAKEASRWGLQVSDAELLTYLQDQYGVQGVAYADYEAWVRRTFQMPVAAFETRAREEALGQKLLRVVQDNVSVSDGELEATYAEEHDRARVNYVRFDTADVETKAPSDEAVAKVLADETETVKSRYEQDVFRYRVPQQVRARQIVKKLKSDASEADVAAAKKALMALRTKIAAGGSFEALAKEHSEDASSRDKGGDMGLFKRGMMAKEIDEATFDQPAGTLLEEPVRTRMGLHLIEVVESQPARRKTLEEVQNEIAKEILVERARDRVVRKKARALMAKLRDGKALDKLTVPEAESSEADGKPVRYETPWLLRTQEAIPRVGASPALMDEIFSLTEDNPVASKPHKVGRSFYVVVLAERETPDMETFAAEKDSLREQAIWSKRSRVVRDWLKHLRERADVSLNPVYFGRDA